MKLLSAILATLALMTATAGATDLGSKDYPLSSYPAWSGANIAFGIGGNFAQTSFTTSGVPVDLGMSGATFAVRFGYDSKLAGSIGGMSGWLGGIYSEIGRESDVHGGALHLKAADQWQYGAGVRAGRYFGTSLLYTVVGYTHKSTSFAGWSTGLDGIKAGPGVEFDLSDHFFGRLEATGSWYNDATTPSHLKLSNVNEEVMLSIGVRLN